MQLVSGLGIGTGMLVVGFALLWFGMPNKVGETPRFLHGTLMQMIYPAIVLTFLVIGVAEVLVASF
jgi:hypothetical protein